MHTFSAQTSVKKGKRFELKEMPLDNKTTRQGVLSKELDRYKNILARQPEVVAVIAFGSVANDRVTENSDVDLLVIEHTTAPFLKRIQSLRKLLHPRIATDIIAYTPEELAGLSKSRPFVRDELLGKGKVLYERKRGTVASVRP